MKKSDWLWFAAFTAFFAVCAAIVFYGTWGLGFVPVSPDDPIGYLAPWSDAVARWWNGIATHGKVLPTDLVWNGIFVSPWFCKELKYCVGVYLAALSVVYFLRGRGLGRLAAYGAGIFLAFSGYWMTLYSAGHGGFYIWMSYGLWSFGLIDRAVRFGSVRHWLLLGLTEAWGSCWQQDIWLTFVLLTGAWYVYSVIVTARGAEERKAFFKRIAFGTALAAAAFAVIGAVSVRDAFVSALASRDKQIEEQSGTALTGGKGKEDKDARWIFVTNWSLPFDETAEFILPRLNGDTSCPLTLSIGSRQGTGVKPYTGALGRPYGAKEGNYRQHSLYVGWYTCLLALAAVWFAFRGGTDRRTVFFFFGAAIVFWLFSLGRYCEPVYRLVYLLPFGDSLRAPVKWHHVTEFCLAVLAGFGIEATVNALLTRGGAGLRKYAPAIVGALVVYGGLALASHDHLYCAALDMTKAHEKNCSTKMTVLSRQDFQNPQVQQMVKAGMIVSHANYLGNPDYFLVDILSPREKAVRKLNKPEPLPCALGLLALLGALAVGAFVWYDRRHEHQRLR